MDYRISPAIEKRVKKDMSAFERERAPQASAESRAPYSRHAERRAASERLPYQGETYYGRPAIKKNYYGWLIGTYLFVGGIAGASQLIATIADLFGGRHDRAIVRAGRYTALAGALISPLLLIGDLHTPRRWYNMLRIFRKTSAMSIGAWTLFGFGTFSGLTAAAQALEDLFKIPFGRTLARLFGLPAAAAGMLMSIYTGTLLSATSVPFWAAANRILSAMFGTSAMATASAALSLLLTIGRAPRGALRRLEQVALIASAAELVLTLAADRRWRRQGLSAPLKRQPIASAYRFGVLGLGIAAPLTAHAANVLSRRNWPVISVAAAVATLLGGFIQRAVIIFAGNDSASRPVDYFQFTQPERRPIDSMALDLAGDRL
jgi:formate-dependent nitrite reductase membrane component NrfD